MLVWCVGVSSAYRSSASCLDFGNFEIKMWREGKGVKICPKAGFWVRDGKRDFLLFWFWF